MSYPIKDGGPAFPQGPSGDSYTDAAGYTRHQFPPIPGMTLRDWFAGMAMQGMLAEDAESYSFESCAGASYKQADAMLAERERKQ